MDTKFSVYSLFNTKGDYSRVTISSSIFLEIAKNNTSIPYTVSKDAKDREIRIFTINGLKVFARTETVEGTYIGKDGQEHPNTETRLYMRTADALPLKTNTPDEVAQYNIDCD